MFSASLVRKIKFNIIFWDFLVTNKNLNHQKFVNQIYSPSFDYLLEYTKVINTFLPCYKNKIDFYICIRGFDVFPQQDYHLCFQCMHIV